METTDNSQRPGERRGGKEPHSLNHQNWEGFELSSGFSLPGRLHINTCAGQDDLEGHGFQIPTVTELWACPRTLGVQKETVVPEDSKDSLLTEL